MGELAGAIPETVNSFVDEYRRRCLWFLRSDYYPQTDPQRLHVLEPKSSGPSTPRAVTLGIG